MCGICGFSGQFGDEILAGMLNRIAHRGPDSDGVYERPESGIGLGHRRLSIIDLSERGRQPMFSQDRNLVLIYNGEIYNYQTLRETLRHGGYQFSSDTDSEVILAGYQRWGPEVVSRLNGIFAFAIYDIRRNELFLVRDGLGVKPLYYAETPSGTIFASEFKAFAPYIVDTEIDLAAVANYITYLYAPSPMTMLKAVRKLEPGHYMFIRNGRIAAHRCYYEIPFHRPIEQMSVTETAAELRRNLAAAVDRQMISDAPVGAFLSGGLDSSSVVAMAQTNASARPFRCFTISTDEQASQREGFVSDLPFARKVAAHLGVELITINSREVSSNLEDMVYDLDEPQSDPAALNVHYIGAAARKLGIKVLLSGAGGDDLLTGYRRHMAMSLMNYWYGSPLARGVLSGIVACLPSHWPATRRGARMLHSMRYHSIDDVVISFFQWLAPDAALAAFADGPRRLLDTDAINAPMRKTLARLPAEADPIRRMLQLDLSHFLVDHNLNYTDKMGMREGVEIRVPFLDLEFVDFAMRLPSAIKQRGVTGKWIFKKAMDGILPHDVIWRPKAGFGVPLLQWMAGEFGESIRDYLSEEAVRRRGLFRPQAITELRKRQQAGRLDAAYALLAMACVEAWLRRFLGR